MCHWNFRQYWGCLLLRRRFSLLFEVSYILSSLNYKTLVYVYVIALAGVIFGIYFTRVVGIAAVKSHEPKPSAISPLYRKRVEYIPEFHDCPCYNIVIPWLHNGRTISLFSR